MHTVVDHAFPSSGTDTTPDIDVEISLSPAQQAPVWRSVRSVGGVDYVRNVSISTKRGRSRELDRFQTGTASLTLDNRNRYFDPEHTASPFYGLIHPNRRFRILARYNDVTYIVFDGFADGFPQLYPMSGTDAVADFALSDGFKVLAQPLLPDSLFEMAVRSLRPSHWYTLADEPGASAVTDQGLSTVAYHGTFNGPTLGTTGLLTYDGDKTCATFDGTNDSLTIPAAAVQEVQEGGNTICVWFQHPTVATNDRTIAFWGNPDTTTGVPSNNTVYLELSGGDAGKVKMEWVESGVVQDTAITTGSFADDAPHLLGIVNGVDLYLDGSLEDSLTSGLDPASTGWTNGSVHFGADLGSGAYANFFNGEMSHIIVFDRALTEAEMTDLYNAGIGDALAETTGTRVGRSLDFTEVQLRRDLDTGESSIGAYDLSSGAVLDYLYSISDSENGGFYMGLDAALSSEHEFRVVFRGRHTFLNASRTTTSQATFGEDTGSGEIPYSDIEIDFDETTFRNDVRFTRQGGTEQVAEDRDSQEKHFRVSYSKGGLLVDSDNEMQNAAEYVLGRSKDPQLRIVGMQLRPQRNPATIYPKALGLEIGDRVTVNRRPQGVGDAISQVAIIEGIEHSFTGGEWTTVLRISPADTAGYWVLGVSELDTETRLGY